MTFFIDAGVIRENEGKNPLTFFGRKIIDDKIISDIEEYISYQELEKAKVLHMNRKDADKARSSMIHWMNDENYKDFLMPIYDSAKNISYSF